MGDRSGADEMAMVGDEPKDGENLLERLFSVGEVVEFWEGSSVRGDRTDSLRLACFCEEGKEMGFMQ